MSAAFVVDDRLKGVPLGTEPMDIASVASRGWNVLRGDVRLPAAVLKDTALRGNGAWMRRFLARSGALFAPHGKTTMSPELFERQLADGAWGLTFATMGQVRAARRHGVPRVFLANVVADPAEAAWAVAELRRDTAFEMLFLVDSEASVALLREAARAGGAPHPLALMLERGYPGGRTGCRTPEDALAVARSVRAGAPLLTLRGVSGFEGLLSADDVRVGEQRVAAFLDSIRESAEACGREGLFGPDPVLLSAGGSAFYDLVLERFGAARLDAPFQVLVRSGCYLTQDGGPYERAFARILERSGAARELGPGLVPALELWAQVLSRPEPTRAVANLGKRDASHDLGLPRPTAVFREGRDTRPVPLAGVTTAGLNDQHALLDLAADVDLRPGDRVAFAISHPCLTFDRWPLLLVVDDGYRVIGAVHTLF